MGLLGSFPALFPRQECPFTQAPPSSGVRPTQVGLGVTSGPDDLLQLRAAPALPPCQLLPTQDLHTISAAQPACGSLHQDAHRGGWGLPDASKAHQLPTLFVPQPISHLPSLPASQCPPSPSFFKGAFALRAGLIPTCPIHPCSSYLCSQSRTVL